MGRLTRFLLLKVPAVRRQLMRFSELEVSVQQQRARLDGLDAAVRQLNERPVEQVQAAGSASVEPALPDAEKEALLEEIAKRDRESRLLRVSYGATFEELEAAGQAGGGAPYRFEELTSMKQSATQAAPSVPPLVFVHVPKVGGTTLNNILMKNYRYRLDSYGSDFFPRYYPDEFLSLVQAPVFDDTRRPVYFTGHIDLDNDVFRFMPVRYLAITMLRDPVQRIVSHYRFHSTLPGSPLATEIQNGSLDIVEYFKRFQKTIPLQYEVFAPRKRPDENGGGTGRVREALDNLESRISFFGLQDHYDAFVVLLQELLGLPDVCYVPLNRTPSQSASVTPEQIAQLSDLLGEDVEFYRGAKTLYERRVATLAFDLAAKVKAFGEAQQRYLSLRGDGEAAQHVWHGFYA